MKKIICILIFSLIAFYSFSENYVFDNVKYNNIDTVLDSKIFVKITELNKNIIDIKFDGINVNSNDTLLHNAILVQDSVVLSSIDNESYIEFFSIRNLSNNNKILSFSRLQNDNFIQIELLDKILIEYFQNKILWNKNKK